MSAINQKKKLCINALIIFVLMTSIFVFSIARAFEPVLPETSAGTHYMLGILGYNYTDNIIDGFSINGQGGGDIRLSSPTTGGGSTVCCLLFSKNPHWPIQIHVRWQHGGCKIYENDRRHGHNQYYYKEAMINLERGSATNPSDVSIHFFKDGTVRAILSNGWEAPLISLKKDRGGDFNFPECKPEEEMQFL